MLVCTEICLPRFHRAICKSLRRVPFRETFDKEGPSVSLGGPDDPLIPLGHQDFADDDMSTTMCPALAEDEAAADRPPLRLAAVALTLDRRRRVLLTRRPRSMRTFPGAWVLPGGSVDPTDATSGHAALRELKEETGLDGSIDGLSDSATPPTPLCVWESCYPVSGEGWAENRREGKKVAHFLICCHVVEIADAHGRNEPPTVTLEPDECDCACWVPLADVVDTLCAPAEHADEGGEYPRAPGSPLLDEPVARSSLRGVYPNRVRGEGIGRAHLWALRQLAEHVDRTRSKDNDTLNWLDGEAAAAEAAAAVKDLTTCDN